jgi:aminoglycoside phosphotransferase (APT) family kinase protein
VREYRVTAALGPTDVPVPPAVLLCEDDEPIGGPFVISDYVDGAVVKTRPQLAALDGATVSGVLDALITTLVALHRVDHRAAGLERFGRPDGYAARVLRRWSGQWAIVGAPPLAGLADEVIGRLAAAVPEQRHTSVVHGDYRIDNTIVRLAPVPVVAAVVDWELSTIGDPVADVAMMCAYRAPAFDLIVGEPGAWTSPDLPDSDGLAARYEAAGGCALADWDVHLALAYFKIAVIAAGIDHRRREGSGSGAGFDTSGEAVGPFLELARHSVAAVR